MSFRRRLREIFRLPQSKQVLDIPESVVKDAEYWFNECKRKSEGHQHMKCPWDGCAGSMLSGPSGGMSENIKCNTCDRAWNMTGIIGKMERI